VSRFQSVALHRQTALLAAIWLLLSIFLLDLAIVPTAQAQSPLDNNNPGFYRAVASQNTAIAPPDFFGVVGRDPWYDFNTDPTNPDRPNLVFEENMAQQLSLMGARWIRIEFHADTKSEVKGGLIDYRKYDAFINEIAPRYHLKVLALIGSGATLAQTAADSNLSYRHINDPADQPDGSNVFIRFFAARVKEIADHYGDKVGAYELLNEPNFWEGFKVDPEKFATLMTLSYSVTKPAHSGVGFILGAIAATGKPELDHVGYLRSIYQSKAVQNFKQSGPHFNNNPFPFDGVAWHPYFADPWVSLYTVDQAIQVMRQVGDASNKIWITETGVYGSFDDSNCNTGSSGQGDEEQAQFLRVLYTQAAQKQEEIANIFWFKYEDFYDGSQLLPFGVVHLSSPNHSNNYNPHYGKVVRYKPAYQAYQNLAAPSLPTAAVRAPAIQWSPSNRNAPYYFPQTEHTLSGPFLNYWLKYGGLDLFGYPLTEPYQELDPSSGKVYTVQWFERERFEYHPENAGSRYEVLLGLLGNELISSACRSFERAKPLFPNGSTEGFYFQETGHNLRGTFKGYWEKRGGLPIFGFPISEEFGEVNPADGKFYVVQYFERARFEYHPEHQGTPYEVELGLLGNQYIANRFKR
jgi:hypothetical protein